MESFEILPKNITKKNPKPGRLKSANESTIDNFNKFRKRIIDSKRKNYVSVKEKLSKYKIPRISSRTLDKTESSQNEISVENQTAANVQGYQSRVPDKNQTIVKKRPENYGSHMNFSLTEVECPKEISKQKPTDRLKVVQLIKENSIKSSSLASSKVGRSASLEETNIKTENNVHCSSFGQHKSDKNELKNSEREYSRVVYEDYYSRLIKTIVEIDPKWLLASDIDSEPPPDISKGAISLPFCFDSYDAYVSTFYPMLVLEIWEEICFHSKPILKSKSKGRFYFSVISYGYKNGIMILNCESVVNETVSFVPSKNNLVILDLKQLSGQCSSSFGFIMHHESKAFDINCISTHEWQHLPKEWLTNAKLWSFDIYVKSCDMTVTNCLMEGIGICNLGDKIRVIDALSCLKFSPLLNDILMPSKNTFSVSYKEERISDYKYIRENVCNAVCDEMWLPSTTAKIMLLQGPPGSGKTNVVASIADKLARCRDFDMKVLVVAPNNFAVDEIGHHLDILNEIAVNPLDFIRLGHSKSPKLLSYSVDKYLEKRRKKYDALYNLWQSDLNEAKLKIDSFCSKVGIENYDAKLKKLQEKYEKLREKPIKKWDHSVEKRQKEKVLIDSKVILATLADCFELFKMKELLKFSCCIIDEINQATELDVLFPFVLGINKFLLVGDPKQLSPNVKSKLMLRCGYQKSILERFQLYFKTKCDNNPAIILTNQFRMHYEICRFPLQYFYCENPLLCSHANGRSKYFPFRPYIVLHDKSELLGTKTIKTLCLSFIQNYFLSSIAIIVPSKVEQELYQSEIVNHLPVEIDTLESFQGCERSIVIISCFHDFSSVIDNSANFFYQEERLNVALTRAVNTLVICGPLHRFTKQRLWSSLVSDARLRGCYVSYECEDDLSSLFNTHILSP